jgi:hypothetical protein
MLSSITNVLFMCICICADKEDEMSFTRTAGAAGVVAVLLMLLNLALVGNQPTLDDPISEVRSYISEDLDMHRAGLLFGAAILPFYAVFLVGIVSLVRVADREHNESWAIVALAGGILIGATATVGDVMFGTLTLRGGAGLDDETIRALWDLNVRAYSSTGLAIGTMIGAVAISALRHPRWDEWYGWLSALAAVLAFVTIIGTNWTSDTGYYLGFLGFLALIVWTIATAVLMLREESPAI